MEIGCRQHKRHSGDGRQTVGSPDRLCINVTVLGRCPSGSAVLRSGARPGDLVCVTGFLGDPAGGLEVILKGLDARYFAARGGEDCELLFTMDPAFEVDVPRKGLLTGYC